MNFPLIPIDYELDTLSKYRVVSSNLQYQEYTLKHQQAFIAVRVFLNMPIRNIDFAHDLDKLILYGQLSKDDASRMHRLYAPHHIDNNILKSSEDLFDTVVDYECARLTKNDKQLNAYEFAKKYYPKHFDVLQIYIKALCLGPEVIDYCSSSFQEAMPRVISALELRSAYMRDNLERLCETAKYLDADNFAKHFYSDYAVDFPATYLIE